MQVLYKIALSANDNVPRALAEKQYDASLVSSVFINQQYQRLDSDVQGKTLRLVLNVN